MEKYKKDNPYLFYVPNVKAEQFIKQLGNLEDGRHIHMFIGGNGSSKCQPGHAPILMADGSWKEMNDIKVGDEIIGVDYESGLAEPTIVTNKNSVGKKIVHRIYFNDGGFVEATDEHEFPVRYRSGKTYVTHGIKKKTKTVKRKLIEIRNRGDVSLSKKTRFIQPNIVEFKNNKLPIHPYLLGALLGDGCIVSKSFSFTNEDENVVKKVDNLLKQHNCYLKQQTDKIQYKIQRLDWKSNPRIGKLYNKGEFKKELEKLNLLDKKSGNKFIPKEYLIASVEDRKQLLAGLIDTDGTINSYVSKSKELSEGFAFLIKSLGGKATISKREAKLYGRFISNVYGVYWRLNFKLPLEIERKQIDVKKPVDYTNRIVDYIEERGEYECFNLGVAHSKHCYISYDWVVTGNSATLANIVANIIFPKKNQYFDFGIFKNWPFEKRLRIVSDPTTVSEKTVPEFLKWFPKGQFKATKDKKSYYSKFYVPETGFEFDIMTYDQSAKEFESVDLGGVFLDEIPPEDIWNACLSRLRVGEGGIQSAYFTPLASAGHLFDKYINNPEQTLAYHTYITVWDNVKGDKTRGFLKRETIERMVATYSEEEREARIEGKFMHLGGTIFKEFDRSKHLKDITLPELVQHIKKKDWRVTYAIDPHPVVNTAVLFMAMLPDGRRVFIDEIWSGSDCKIISKLINEKLDYFERLGANTLRRIGIIDPSAVIEDKLRGGTSWIEDFKNNGVALTKATKDRDRADDLVRQELRGTVEPNLYLLKGTTCRTAWEMARYQKNPKDPTKRLDKDDHMVECAGRLLIAYPIKLFSKTREEKRRKIIQGIG